MSAPASIPHVGAVLASLVVESLSNCKLSIVSDFCLIVDLCFHPSRALARSLCCTPRTIDAKPRAMDAKHSRRDRWTGQTQEGANAHKPRCTRMCVREIRHQGPLKNPSMTHFCVPKNTSFSLFLVVRFYHLFLPILTLLTIVGYQSHCIQQRCRTPVCCHKLLAQVACSNCFICSSRAIGIMSTPSEAAIPPQTPM